ncbi:unnamed protein product [Ectocarpus sp. 8 AP-2014]
MYNVGESIFLPPHFHHGAFVDVFGLPLCVWACFVSLWSPATLAAVQLLLLIFVAMVVPLVFGRGGGAPFVFVVFQGTPTLLFSACFRPVDRLMCFEWSRINVLAIYLAVGFGLEGRYVFCCVFGGKKKVRAVGFGLRADI